MGQAGGKRPGAGRKKGVSTLAAEKAREYITRALAKELPPIVKRAIDDAKKGDKYARDWLSERSWGKPITIIEPLGDEGSITVTWGHAK